MLFFQAGGEWETARRQFDIIEKLKLPGQLHESVNPARLLQQLRSSVEQHLRCRLIAASNGQAVPPGTGVEVTRAQNNPAWFPGGIKQDTYIAEVQTGRLLKQEVRFEDGDFVLAKLGNDNFERELLAENCQPSAPPLTRGDWQLSVLQDQQLLPTAPLQLFVAIEDFKNRHAIEGHLKQNKPTFSWFELEPRGARQARFSLQFGNLQRYPAYATGLDVPAWPMQDGGEAGALPVLHAWWLTNGPPQPERFIDRGSALPLEVQIDGDKVAVESVSFEDRLLKTSPDEIRPVHCLAVRLRHAPNKPVFVQLEGLSHKGEEHRVYKEANSTTSFFWSVDESASLPFRLGLVSLAAFKREAVYSGPVELPAPNPLQIRQNILRAPPARP
jgi:hypothetical protein